MKPSISNWNERYADASEYLFGTAPNAFLERQKSRFKPGMKVLAVCDGEGRNGVWMAQLGCEVWSVDAAPNATDKARRLAAERGVSDRMHILTHDMMLWDWQAQQFDAVVGIFFQFANPKMRTALFQGMQQATRPGGLILLEGYGLKQLEFNTGGPKDAENLYTIPLVREEFGEMNIELTEEYDASLSEGARHQGMSALVDMVATKPL
ncbi:MAG: class I SAM-dependent methyltransferase [Sheuella sp.]|nr:class I SAM-dependent methyltransferase [Sheuella sp.]